MVCLLGDLNAQIGNVKRNGGGGEFRIEGLNEKGELLVEVCVQNEVAVCNTFY